MADPAELKVLGSKVLQDTSYSPALYDYKTILADPGENLIGFLVESYDRGVKRDYELYQWNGEDLRGSSLRTWMRTGMTMRITGVCISERSSILPIRRWCGIMTGKTMNGNRC